jgi:hypothetical protein
MNTLKRVIYSILFAISIMIVIFALIEIAMGNVFLGVFFLIFAVPLSLPFVIFELKKSKENEIKAVPQENVQNQTISQNQENTGTEKSEKIEIIRQDLNRQPEIQKVITTPTVNTQTHPQRENSQEIII